MTFETGEGADLIPADPGLSGAENNLANLPKEGRYDRLADFTDHLMIEGVGPVAPYNARNTDDPKDIEYRVEYHITEHSEDVLLKQSTLDETYNRRTGVERTNESVKDCGLGLAFAGVQVRARAQVFIALCLRLVVAITN